MLFKRRQTPSLKQRTREIVTPEKGYARMWHYLLWRIKRRPGTPEFIARGFAIGVAINFWPLLFTHFLCGLALCWIMSGDVIAMFIGTMLGNPWTFAIVYPIMYKIGKALLGLRPTHSEASIDSVEEIWDKIWPVHSWDSLWIALRELVIPMALGGFLLALPCAIISYYLARNAIRVYHAQRRKNLKEKFDAVEAEIEQNNPHAS
jgi:uncharacterized protein (DUF2062 family)